MEISLNGLGWTKRKGQLLIGIQSQTGTEQTLPAYYSEYEVCYLAEKGEGVVVTSNRNEIESFKDRFLFRLKEIVKCVMWQSDDRIKVYDPRAIEFVANRGFHRPPLAIMQSLQRLSDNPIQCNETIQIFPESASIQYRTFKYFTERGMFLVDGHKFGGDFLLYQKDPSTCHSSHVIKCINTIQPLEFLSLCRICTNTKKRLLLVFDNFRIIEFTWIPNINNKINI